MKLEKEIKAYAIKNALEFGKAEPSKILPKLFRHGLEKSEIKNIMPEIIKTAKEINSLSKENLLDLFKEYEKFVKVREEKEKDLPELKLKDTKNVVTRLAPEPSKYLHLGHAMSFLLNYLYAKKYNGKCLLRFEDTNPEKVSQEYVNSTLDDIKNYLEIKIDGIRYISDDMEILYNYAEKLVKIEKAYMCFCDREKMQDLRHKGVECACRKNSIEKNLAEWRNFLKGKYMKGEAVLRIKGDMKSQNHVMRDSVILRAIAKKHYRHGNKYKVWPMYDFYNPIEDSLMGITLILRSNEFDLRVELQDYIKDILGLKKQTIVQYGRFNVIDFTTKGREIRDLIASKEFLGWDDPRLITLKALKRRGIVKETIYELTKQVGLSKNQVNLEFEMLAAINRKIIDATANRYSFVANPMEIKIKNAPKIKQISIPVHPEKKETRNLRISKMFISEEDFKKFKGKEIRLLHLYNIKLDKKENKAEFMSLENKDIQKINWVSEPVKCKILMPSGIYLGGLAEKTIERLKNNEIIQFERFGFAKLDKKRKNNYEFWFAHK
ncbi:glutamate--tRNA ligase [Candidatus Pacearchaeota archaeon]|nr:glutamate--tRNA ligase [Candidatus Pacearchaeota archaeon]